MDVQCDYIGESARTPFDRGQDHLDSLRSGDKSNALVMHMIEDHPGTTLRDHSFTMKILRFHKTNLSRQAHEGLEISRYKGQKIMNRKGEWGSNLSPELTVEDKNGNIRRSDSQLISEQPRAKRSRGEVGQGVQEENQGHSQPVDDPGQENDIVIGQTVKENALEVEVNEQSDIAVNSTEQVNTVLTELNHTQVSDSLVNVSKEGLLLCTGNVRQKNSLILSNDQPSIINFFQNQIRLKKIQSLQNTKKAVSSGVKVGKIKKSKSIKTIKGYFQQKESLQNRSNVCINSGQVSAINHLNTSCENRVTVIDSCSTKDTPEAGSEIIKL